MCECKKSQIARNQNSPGGWTRSCMMHTHFNVIPNI